MPSFKVVGNSKYLPKLGRNAMILGYALLHRNKSQGETPRVRISGQPLEWTVSSRYDTQLISGNSELFHKVRPILIWTASPPGLQVRKPEQDIR